jgi:hypothetical protein
MRAHFAPKTNDIDWISALQQDGDWMILSGDLRIVRLPQELQAWKESGLTAFFLAKGWGQLTFWDKAWRLVKQWPAILRTAETFKRGTGILVSVGGKMEPIL